MKKTLLISIVILLIGLGAYTSYLLKNKICETNRANEKIALLQDSIQQQNKYIEELEDAIYDESLFNLNDNVEAIRYLQKNYSPRKDYPEFIRKKLLETNVSGEDNPLVPFAGMEGNMQINNVRILNHKWIIASFTDNTYWGEMLMEYEPVGQDSIRFEVIKAFIYPPVHN